MTEHNLRRIQPIDTRDVVPAEDVGVVPEFVYVNPTDVYVDEKYQRNLSTRSLRMIRKIVAGFNYQNYKPPILVPYLDGYKAIDGQHTLIAAASHPGIKKVPALVFQNEVSIEEQAGAFVAHNTNRVAVTPLQLFKARLAAGEPVATQLREVCTACGVTIIVHATPVFSIAETICVSTLERMMVRLTQNQFEIVLQTCARAKLAPIRNGHLLAVENLLWDPHAADLSPYDVESALRDLAADDVLAKIDGTSKRSWVTLVGQVRAHLATRRAA